MRSIRFFLALIIFVAGGTTSLRTDAVTVTDEYGDSIQTDQELLFMGGVPHPADPLLSGASRELASVLKNRRILMTAGVQKTLAEDYDPNVEEADSVKAKTSFYDLMLVASENQNAVGKRKLEKMPKKRASKKPAKPIGCPNGFNYNTCCQGCGAVFTSKGALSTAVSNYNPSATSSYGKMNCWDVTKVTDMSYLFYENWSFNERIDCWNVSQVTTMSWMFAKTEYFNQPLNNWDTSRVTDMSYMFTGYIYYYGWYYTPFNQPLNQWNTSRVTDMNQMFQYSSFNQPLAQWDISRVGNMYRMFLSAFAFNQNLCPWYNKTSAGVVYGDTFYDTKCQNTADPNYSTKTSFCANCSP